MRDYPAGGDSNQGSTIVIFIVWPNTMYTVTVYEKIKQVPIGTFYNELQIPIAACENTTRSSKLKVLLQARV